MFLKRNRRTKDGETYEYWSLVETVRTARGPRHRLVATASCPGSTASIATDGKTSPPCAMGGRNPSVGPLTSSARGARMRGAGATEPGYGPRWMEVDVRGLRLGRARDFGQVYLARALWRRLGLHTLLEELLPGGRGEVPWPLVACILTIVRFCGNRSELEVAGRDGIRRAPWRIFSGSAGSRSATTASTAASTASSGIRTRSASIS
jgi:hypothetical protein